MKLNRRYEADPEQLEPVRKVYLKGLGATVVTFILVVFIGTLAHMYTSSTVSTIVDIFSVLALLIVIQTYSRGVAGARLVAAREMQKKGRQDQTLALLLPFINGGVFNAKSRFDKTGEAMYRLAKAASVLGEEQLMVYCQAFLARFRKGEWAKKAAKLKVG